LAEQRVLGQVPEGRLHHLEVPAAQAVHEGGQEVSRSAARDARWVSHAAQGTSAGPSGGGGCQAYLGLFWMERSARLKAKVRQDSSAELIRRCRLVCVGQGDESRGGLRAQPPALGTAPKARSTAASCSTLSTQGSTGPRPAAG
jgi:hypothetical protein